MSNGTMPFVAIIGGFYEFDPRQIDAAWKMAREIGEALAAAGFGLVVYHSNKESLEPHVVTGYASKIPPGAGAGSIRVRFAESQRNDVTFPEQAARADLFQFKLFPGDNWELPFYRSLAEAEGVDAVLLMAGARSTLIAGQIAVARRLPVLAVDSFGGSARLIWSELTREWKDYPSSTISSPSQMVGWLKERCNAEAKRREQVRLQNERCLKLMTQAGRSRWAAVAFVALLLVVYFAMAQTPSAARYTYLTLAGLVAAGATGALTRSVIWGAEGTAPTASVLLGAAAGFVVGLAYLIPQWIGAPGVLAPSAKVVQATDKIQFASALLVAISAGVGFDTVFTRLKGKAEEHVISPPGRAA